MLLLNLLLVLLPLAGKVLNRDADHLPLLLLLLLQLLLQRMANVAVAVAVTKEDCHSCNGCIFQQVMARCDGK